MNRKVMKVVSILLVVLMVVAMLSTSVFADEQKASDITVGSVWTNAKDSSGASGAVSNIIGSIITIVQMVGIGVAIIMLMVLAIKYISAAPSEKAEIKKSVTIYVVGAVVLFAASGVLQIIKNFATTNVKVSTDDSVSYVQMQEDNYLV